LLLTNRFKVQSSAFSAHNCFKAVRPHRGRSSQYRHFPTSAFRVANSNLPQCPALSTQHLWFFLTALLFTLCVITLPAANAAQVTLAWDKNTELDIAGYKMNYGTASGTYPYSVDVGNHTSCTISGLAEDTTYYFAATAYNSIGESGFSEEISYSVRSEPDPSTQPDPAYQPDPPTEPDLSTEPVPTTELIDEIIIDNGDDGTFFSGTWRISRSPNPYGLDSLYSRDRAARYTFEAALDGSYGVSLWWTGNSTWRCNRCVER